MDQATRKLITELGEAVREVRRQHEALTMMFDSLVRGVDALEEQADRDPGRPLRSVS